MHSPSLPNRSIEMYGSVIDSDQLERLRSLAESLPDVRVLHVNSTATGGGVAELLRSIVPVCDDLGVQTDWVVMDATDEFFEVTKAIHNGLQGDRSPLTESMKSTYRAVTERNAAEIEDVYDLVVIHDPQPLGMLERLEETMPNATYVWRCHIDITDPSEEYLAFVSGYTSRVDHAIVSRSAYEANVEAPKTSVVHPSIDPLTKKNRSIDEETIETERDRMDPLSFDAPLVTQVSRFDPWKDQFGTLEAFHRAREHVTGLQLALAGGMAGDDPEGLEIYEQVAEAAADDPDVHVLTDLPDTRVNVLQRGSDVVVQKSLREGFGLVVSEALWKRTPVVGSNVGGIPLQVEHGQNGYLVEPDDVQGVADHLVTLLEDEDRRTAFGSNGRAHVRDHFLLPRQLADLFGVFVTVLERDS
ncbi:glycosyltransferase [Natronosalvus rutilus]|uniref:Glycosyltransferase n=1 Tax=Natronosalvus rutilus TaxID=2953753 RepID=A0A9E7NC29_9EURY|nr:glycosyltransferase [Natronosalvus rutilus]UTF55562.1 glycosyltransferase [Natronosalvus rutilus]